MANAVKCANPQAIRAQLEQLADPISHLPRRLVGEGDGQQTHRRDMMDLDQPGDSVNQDAGFSRARSRQDQDVFFTCRDGVTLGIVELVE